MEFKINRISRAWPPAVLIAGTFGALAVAEQDSSQFGFLTGESPSTTGSLRADAARPQEAKRPEGADSADAGEANSDRGNFIPQWLHFGLTVQSLYDDNIFLSDEQPDGAWVNRVTPMLRVSSAVPDGALWAFEGVYSPVWTTYSSSAGKESFDHVVAATLRYNGSRLRAAALASYQEASGNDRFVRDIFTTAISRGQLLVNYELSGRTSLESRLLWENIDRQDTGSRVYNDDRTVSLQVSALWQATAITRIGPSVRVGSTTSSLSPDRTFVDALVRVDYDSHALLKFSGQAGAQWVSFNGDRGSYWRPSVSFTGEYEINPFWQIVVSAYSRSAAAPSIQNADLQTSGFTGSLRWMPTDSLQFMAGAGYERGRYDYFDPSASNRTDDYSYGELRFRAGRESSPLAIELFYRHRLSDSSSEGQDFENNQAGVQISRQF